MNWCVSQKPTLRQGRQDTVHFRFGKMDCTGSMWSMRTLILGLLNFKIVDLCCRIWWLLTACGSLNLSESKWNSPKDPSLFTHLRFVCKDGKRACTTPHDHKVLSDSTALNPWTPQILDSPELGPQSFQRFLHLRERLQR